MNPSICDICRILSLRNDKMAYTFRVCYVYTSVEPLVRLHVEASQTVLLAQSYHGPTWY